MSIRFFSTFLLSFLLAGCASTPGTGETAVRKDRSSLPAHGIKPAVIQTVQLSDSNQRLFNGAVSMMKQGQHAQAERLWLELTRKEPNLSTPWVNLAKVYQAQSRGDDAMKALEHAIEVNPNNCPAYNEIGVVARKNGDFSAAEESYLACIRRVPQFREAYLNLGILYELYLGKLTEALDAYRRYQALSDEPDRRVQGWVVDLERRVGNRS